MLYNTFPGFGTKNPVSHNLKQPRDFRRQSRKNHHRCPAPWKAIPIKILSPALLHKHEKKRTIRHKPPQKPLHRTRKKQPDDSRQTAIFSYYIINNYLYDK